MARSRNTRNMERVSDETPSARKDRKKAESNGRGRNQPYTSGARSVNTNEDNAETMAKRWKGRNPNGTFAKRKVAVYTHNKHGELSVDGKTHSGITNGLTEKSSKAKGQKTVRQAVGSIKGGKVDREEAARQLMQQNMNIHTANRLLRAGLITQEERMANNPMPDGWTLTKEGRAQYRAMRRALGMSSQ